MRKINLDRWGEPAPGFAAGEVPAELVRQEFNAKENALSLWRASDDAQGLDRAALAIASGFDRIETFDIAWFAATELAKLGVEIQETLGKTRIESLKKEHVDAVRLDGFRLASVAATVARAVVCQRCKRYSNHDAADLLLAAMENKLLGATTLPKVLRDALEDAKKRKEATGGA